jgi:hypothetical protein
MNQKVETWALKNTIDKQFARMATPDHLFVFESEKDARSWIERMGMEGWEPVIVTESDFRHYKGLAVWFPKHPHRMLRLNFGIRDGERTDFQQN